MYTLLAWPQTPSPLLGVGPTAHHKPKSVNLACPPKGQAPRPENLAILNLSPHHQFFSSFSSSFYLQTLSPQSPRSPPVTMASRSFTKTLRAPVARQLASVPRVQQRTFVAAARAAVRAGAVARPVAAGPAQQQIRGVKTIDFAGHKEDVYGKLFSRLGGFRATPLHSSS